MLRGQMELPSEMLGLAVSEGIVVLTEEEYEALEAREPQASAEVIERARRWAQQLRLWPRRATPTEDGLRLIPEDCLRRCSAAFDALLAAVEAAPEPAPEPAPDFAAMSPDELRAWLDERGRRWTWNSRSCEWAARLDGNDFNSTIIARTVDHPTEPAALLALCQKVAAKEASC